MSILTEIFAHKHQEVAARLISRPLAQVRAEAEQAPARRNFVAALRRSAPNPPSTAHWPRLIAEVKRASPSRGLLVRDFDPLRLARLYQQNGAAAISVLTDEAYFQGRLDDLAQISRLELGLPLLRKDFIFDPYQVYEARAAGADAILLIAAALDLAQLRDLHALAGELGMAALIEIHHPTELEKALACNPTLLGINNRDLHTFAVDLETTLQLRPFIPPEICLVAESGIHQRADLDRLAKASVDAILVGEALVTAPDVAARVRDFVE